MNPRLLRRELEILLAAPNIHSVIDKPDNEGQTPLVYALNFYPPGDIDGFVDMLLPKANPFATDNEGNCVLHSMVSSMSYNPGETINPMNTFKKFLSIGLSINSRNAHGESVLFKALKDNYLSPGGIEFYLEHGASLFDLNNHRQTLLHLVGGKRPRRDAVPSDEHREADVDSWKYLIEKGLDPSQEDCEQRSAWDLAVAAGNTRVLELAQK